MGQVVIVVPLSHPRRTRRETTQRQYMAENYHTHNILAV